MVLTNYDKIFEKMIDNILLEGYNRIHQATLTNFR